MRAGRLDRSAALAVVALLGMGALGSSGTEAAWVLATANPGNSYSSAADWKPPIVRRAAVLKAEGGIPGYVRTIGRFTVLGQVDDDPSSNPPAGVATVRADIGSAIALSAADAAVAGQTYNWQSAPQTLPAGYAEGTSPVTLTATDDAEPPNGSAAFLVPLVVDDDAPTAASLAVTNGGEAGRPDAGDALAYSWTDVVDPHSVLPGWTGAATDVTVRIADGGSSGTADSLTVWNAENTAQLPLGAVALGGDYVGSTTTFGGPPDAVRSAMTWAPSPGTRLVVVLGPPDTAGAVRAATATAHVWTPSAAVFDRAGNAADTEECTDDGGAGRDF